MPPPPLPSPSRAQIGALAGAFADVLAEWLPGDEFRAMRGANRGHLGSHTCASHDHCDANMAMLAAFKRVFGREPRLDGTSDLSPFDAAVWEAAWALSKPLWLTAPVSGSTSHATLLVRVSDQDGTNLTTLAALLEDLRATASAAVISRLVSAIAADQNFQAGGGAEPVWDVRHYPEIPA